MQHDTFLKSLDVIFSLFNFKQVKRDADFRLPTKVLLVLPDYLGDCVLLTPFIRNLKYNMQTSGMIDIVCSKPVANLLKTNSYLRRIYLNSHIYNKQEFLRRGEYDTVFILNYSLVWAFSASQADVAQIISPDLARISISKPPILDKVLTHTVTNTSIKSLVPQLKVNLSYLDELGLEIFDHYPEIRLTDQDDLNVLDYVKTDRPKAYIHMTAGSKGKEWEFEKWVEVVKFLKNQRFEVFACGTEIDRNVYQKLEDESKVWIRNLCGKTSVRETIALLQYMDLVITTDSAPAHFAALARTPRIAVIYGPTNQHQWRPYAPFSDVEQISLDLDCRPCVMRKCDKITCLRSLDSDYVIQKIGSLISRRPVPKSIY